MKIEIRNNQMKLSGYVNAVGRESRVMYNKDKEKTFVETVQPKTFEKALLKGEEVRLLFNHNPSRELESTSSGNFKLYEDSIGLYADATITDPEVIEEARNGNLTGWSFGFIDQRETWVESEQEPLKRSLTDIKLTEVSVLNKMPAYVAMSIETRCQEEATVEEIRYLEDREVELVEEADTRNEQENNTDEQREKQDHLKLEIEVLRLKGE